MSTCPWSFDMDYDENRTPVSLARARCSCDKCLPRSGDYNGHGKCLPVMAFIPVVRRRCKTDANEYEYKGLLESVAVGCTCIRPKSIS
ncbi:hypothetical protein ACJMK2_011819 [Sinanodonta woodiana]|uniref:Interleukin 17-like protein n=1 Tax=Sinanodonta woodiana TaxID=1069815 RepID=A0ABD3V680_SINWO